MIKQLTLLLALLSIVMVQGFSQNIALSKQTKATSGNSAAAVDGDKSGSRWESEHGVDPQSIAIDLGQSYNVEQVVLYWEGAYATEYTIDISTDSVNWTSIYTETAGDGGTDDLTVSGTGQYIRMHGTTRATGYGYSIWEFEVYAAVDPTKDASLSDLLVDGTSIEGFSKLITDYSYGVVKGTSTVPTVSATPTNSGADVTVNATSTIPGTTTVEVISDDGTETETYSIKFFEATPNVAAPTPTKDEGLVISVYSDAYTSIATNLNPGWGQSTIFSEEQILGNNTLKYENLTFQGTEYTNSDVSIMEYVHFDYFTGDATALEFSLIAGGENAYNIETELGITLSEWVSVDIPMSYYEDAGRDLEHAIQFKISGNGTVFIDNMYFWKNPTPPSKDITLSDLTVDGETIDGFGIAKLAYKVHLPDGTSTVPAVVATPTNGNAQTVVSPAGSIPGQTSILVTSEDQTTTETYTIDFVDDVPAIAAPVPSEDPNDVISVYSDTYTSIASNLNPGWGQSTKFSQIQIDGNNTLMYEDLDFQGTDYPTTDVSEMDFLRFDYWTLDATALEFYLIADGENSYNVATELGITTGSWVQVEIPLSHFEDAGRDLTIANQFKVTGDGTVYIDNMFFSKAPPPPGSDASLTAISVNGYELNSFSGIKLSYDVGLAIGTTAAPTVTATTKDPDASYVVNNAASIPGSTTIVVTSQNTTVQKTYTLNFEAVLPAEPAPEPTIGQDSVLAVYSDAYDEIYTTLVGPWTNADDVTEMQIESGNVVYYTTCEQAMTAFDETDLTAYNRVHVDYYTSDDSKDIQFSLYDGADTNPFSVNNDGDGVVADSWQSVDIPLHHYTSDLTATTWFKTHGDVLTLFVDNIYFYIAPPGVNATLADLTVDGETIEDFASNELNYEYKLPFGATEIPEVEFELTDTNATFVVTKADKLPGTTEIEVTSEDEKVVNTYRINFVIGAASKNADLSDILIDLVSLEGFKPDSIVYRFELPFGTTEVPQISAVVADTNSTFVVDQAETLPDTAFVNVTAQDGLTSRSYKVIFELGEEGGDASLHDLRVNDVTIDGFSPLKLSYTVGLPKSTTEVPLVTAFTNDANALSTVSATTELPGTTAVQVVSANEKKIKVYTIDFILVGSQNASLKDIQVDGESIANFADTTLNYTVELQAGTTTVPTITVTTADTNATAAVTPASVLPGTTTIVVTAEDTTITQSYSVKFIMLPSTVSSLSDLQVDGTTISNFDAETLSYTVELESGTTEVPTVSAVATDTNATVEITPAADLFDDAQVTVTAEDGITTTTYTVSFDVKTAIDYNLNTAISIYPNPANNVLFINSDVAIDVVEVYNITGRKLERKFVNNSIDVSNLESGVYLLKVKSNNQLSTIQFIKQ